MQISNAFWSALTKQIAKERADMVEQMALGKYRGSHEKYIDACGRIAGLDRVMQIAEDLLKDNEENHDDD